MKNIELRGIYSLKSAISNLKLSLLFFSYFIFHTSFAQIYPVNVSIFTTAPHRNYLSSYADDARLRVALTLTDFSVPSRTVRLKFRFEAPNGFIHESQLSTPISYTLFSGETKVLTTEELMPYFVSSQSTQNLLYEGASSICIEVTDNQTGSLLNFNSCTYFQIDYGKTAQCILPECESVFDIGTNYMLPTPIEFTFSPPFAPQNEFGNVRNKIYVFQYDSLIPQQNLRPPLGLTSVILGGFPFEVPIGSANYLPAPNMLLLEKGKKYMWMVRSVLIDPITGLERINQFEHDGWSMPCIFQYGEKESIAESLLNGIKLEWNDALPSSFSAGSTPSNTQGDGLQALGERKALAKWKVVNENSNAPSFSLDKYIVSYRKISQAGQAPWDWHHDTTTDFVMSIYQLEPSTTYEVYVRGMLGTSISDSTPVRNITTDSTRTYACGEENLPARMPIYEPLLKLEAGNSVKIGTFDLNVTSVEALGETGHYKGYGLIPVKFLGGVNTKVRFDDLKIDKEFVVWEGMADVLTDGLNAWLDEQYIQFQDPIFVNGTVSSAYVSDSLAYVVVNGTPQSFTFPCPSCPVIINDVNGNQIVIYANGTINWGTYLDVTGELLGVNNTSVGTFSQHENEIGGFDAKEHMQWHENYEIIQSLDSMAYFVPNKSMFVGEDDIVYLNVPKDSFPNGSITLNVNGNTINEGNSTDEGNIRKIEFTIPSFSSDGKKTIYALASNLNNVKIAKINIEVYEKLEKIVKIIPIASTNLSASSVEAYLEQTIGEAGIDFTVNIEEPYLDSVFNSTTSFNIPNATLMQKYSPQMRDLKNAYFGDDKLADDTYYIFVVNSLIDSSTNESVLGYMVRGKQYGFITANSSLLTISHELGHGIGVLEHTWFSANPPKGTTTNLMDYNEGNNLLKSQWEEIRNPTTNAFWDDEEDQEFFLTTSKLPGKRNSDGTFTTISPSMEIVVLPTSVDWASSAFGTELGSSDAYVLFPTGTLFSFDIKNNQNKVINYKARVDANGNFMGYFNSSNQKFTQFVNSTNKKGWFTKFTNTGLSFAKFDFNTLSFLTSSSQPKKILDLKNYQDCVFSWQEIESTNPTWEIRIDNNTIQNLDEKFYFDNYYFIGNSSWQQDGILMTKAVELISRYPNLLPYVTYFENVNRWQHTSYSSVAANEMINTLHELVAPEDYEEQVNFEDGSLYTRAGIFDYKVKNKGWYDENYFSSSFVLKEFIISYLKIIKKYREENQTLIDQITYEGNCIVTNEINRNSDKFIHTLSSYSTSSTQIRVTPLQLRNALNCMSESELYDICPRTRVNLISVMLEQGETRDVIELPIVRLFRTCKSGQDAVSFLILLEKYKRGNTKHLLGELLSKVDDETCFIGSDNFTLLSQHIMSLYPSMLLRKNYTSEFTSYYDEHIKPFTEPDEFTDAKKIRERYITYHYEGAVKRLFLGVFTPPTNTQLVSEVYFSNTSGNIFFRNNFEHGFITMYQQSAAIQLSPFDPIVYDNGGKAFSPYGDGRIQMLAPALMLYFAEKKAISTSATDLVQLGVDVATFFIPGVGTTNALKLLNYIDKASAITSIVSNGTQYDYPQLSRAFTLTSSLLGFVTLSPSDAADLKNFKNVSSARKAELYAQMSVVANYDDELKRVCDNILGQTNYTVEEKKFLETLLEGEKKMAGLENKTVVLKHINDALNYVKNSNIYTATIQKFEQLVQSNLLTKSGNKYKYNAIEVAKVESGVLYVNQKNFVSNFSGLDPDAELLTFMDEIDYIKNDFSITANATNQAKLSDLFIFKKNNKIFCLEGANCFTANTLVKTIHGLKPIETIVENDTVQAFDEVTNTNSWQRVTQLFKRSTDKLQRLVIGSDTLFVTADHLFKTANSWIRAGSITVGTLLQTVNGFSSVNSNISINDTTVFVYNFTVENAHTYFVGNGEVLTHNDCNKFNDFIASLPSEGHKKAFVNTLKNNSDIFNAFENGTISFESWRIITNAINNSGIATSFANDIESLKQVSKMIKSNSTFRTKVGSNWELDLKDIIKTAETSPCNSCGNSGLIGRIPMDEHLKNVDYFVQNIDLNTKGEGLYNWMRGKTLGVGEPLETQLDELHQTLDVIKREGITNGELVDLGKQFPNGSKKYDILLGTGEYFELKNKIYTNSGISTSDADQLIDGYFRNIDDLDDFTWELKWDKNKSVWATTSQAENAMKEKWKVIFLNREQEIFEIIWNNQNFRNNIFDINISRIDAELDFHDFISNSSSIIYNFIKVR